MKTAFLFALFAAAALAIDVSLLSNCLSQFSSPREAVVACSTVDYMSRQRRDEGEGLHHGQWAVQNSDEEEAPTGNKWGNHHGGHNAAVDENQDGGWANANWGNNNEDEAANNNVGGWGNHGANNHGNHGNHGNHNIDINAGMYTPECQEAIAAAQGSLEAHIQSDERRRGVVNSTEETHRHGGGHGHGAESNEAEGETQTHGNHGNHGNHGANANNHGANANNHGANANNHGNHGNHGGDKANNNGWGDVDFASYFNNNNVDDSAWAEVQDICGDQLPASVGANFGGGNNFDFNDFDFNNVDWNTVISAFGNGNGNDNDVADFDDAPASNSKWGWGGNN